MFSNCERWRKSVLNTRWREITLQPGEYPLHAPSIRYGFLTGSLWLVLCGWFFVTGFSETEE
jgi:hypothetical protein